MRARDADRSETGESETFADEFVVGSKLRPRAAARSRQGGPARQARRQGDALRRRARRRGGDDPARLLFPFILTARTESFLRGNPNLDDVIKRLQAFETAGADVLMAPGLPDLAAVRAVCAAVSKPVNFMAGIKGKSFTVAELDAAGVRRISLATSLYRYDDEPRRGRTRGKGQGDVRLHRPLDPDPRPRRVHAGLSPRCGGGAPTKLRIKKAVSQPSPSTLLGISSAWTSLRP